MKTRQELVKITSMNYQVIITSVLMMTSIHALEHVQNIITLTVTDARINGRCYSCCGLTMNT
ncbi:TPA: hypothetical protein SMS53_001211 [Proteus mirabilis]|uniref:hypothetical protein n=1 Tax=Proteus mirabilis TaxID=584 RepID=UPI001A298150|nr:hypothetical protein [Proteus mirabilis]ELA7719572.1 hypothetical protein [Proteus mirabilis]EMA1120495.1 hypothetical protein [Proteus mirabilis]MBI6274939.1 hypothetical protein [Proteus mirabilis]MBI6518389.1 hypothetical protein [Proteus mirabilis]MDM3689679.1 hypothetical protein [Proteus mirabilis]